jgi:hypothetical protein
MKQAYHSTYDWFDFREVFFYTGNKEVSNIVLSIFLSANFRTIHVIVVRIYNICPHWPPKQLHQNYDMDRMEPLLPRTKGNTVTTMIITFLQRVPLSRRPTPLKNTKIWKSVGIIIRNIWKNEKCYKPPTRFTGMLYEIEMDSRL